MDENKLSADILEWALAAKGASVSENKLRDALAEAVNSPEVIYEHDASGNYAVVPAWWYRGLPERIELAMRGMFQRGWLARDICLGKQETSRWMLVQPSEEHWTIPLQHLSALRGTTDE